MFRLVVKISALVAWATLVFFFYKPSSLSASVGGGLVLLLGAISLNKDMALRGAGKDPGVLHIVTCCFLIAPVVLFHVLPANLYKLGLITKAPTNDWLSVLITFMASIFMALALWVPMLCYEAIDFVFHRMERSTTPAASR